MAKGRQTFAERRYAHCGFGGRFDRPCCYRARNSRQIIQNKGAGQRVNTVADSRIYTYAHTHCHTDSHTDSIANSDSNSDSNARANANTYAHTDANTRANTYTHAYAYTDTYTGACIGPKTRIHSLLRSDKHRFWSRRRPAPTS